MPAFRVRNSATTRPPPRAADGKGDEPDRDRSYRDPGRSYRDRDREKSVRGSVRDAGRSVRDQERSVRGSARKQPEPETKRSLTNSSVAKSKLDNPKANPKGKKAKDNEKGNSNSAAKDAKIKGNQAFKDGELDEAIRQYTRALKVDPTDFVCTANRSAAFLKNGNPEKALQDAETCIKLKSTYAKGHIRKAGALHALKKFTGEVKAYQVGVELCPEDKLLKQGLEQARRSRAANSRASQAARKTEATLQAVRSVRKKAGTSRSVSQFVTQTRKKLELQMAAVESQMQMIAELEKMKMEEKLDLLYSLLDRNHDGTIDAKELANGLQKRNSELKFIDAVAKAIELVAMYDDDGDAVLDRQEFEYFVKKMVKELDATADEFCEFLVYQLLFSESKSEDMEDVDMDNIKEEVKERGQLLDALHDPRMDSLFVLFDRNGDGIVSFKEVACGLFHLTKDMHESAKATTGLLLMMDVDDKRVLAFEQFAKLILAIAAAAGTSFEEVANDLTLALTSRDNSKFDRETMRVLTLAERDYKRARDRAAGAKTQAKILDALSYGRTLRLFDLWDANGDGHINFEELFAGLQRYQAAAARETNLNIDAERVATQLMALDADGDHSLDREEFATAMVTYADAMRTDLHQLIDFMCVVTALEKVI